jgi:hypothetical protein
MIGIGLRRRMTERENAPPEYPVITGNARIPAALRGPLRPAIAFSHRFF